MRKLLGIIIAVALFIPSLALAQSAVLGPAANPKQSVEVISQSAIPFVVASSGTMGNNCAISAMTALPRTLSNGAYLYLPANAIAAGSAAGWYWFVGSSTTAGTCYNSTYTSGTPTIGTTTAFATTGPGAFTGETGAITAISLTIPAGALGANGRLEGQHSWAINSTAGAKTIAWTFGGTNILSVALTTQQNIHGHFAAHNRGLTNRQHFSQLYNYGTGGASGNSTAADGTIDTTAAVTLAVVLTHAVATDHILLDDYHIRIEYGN